jgi:co-chaperonin GroES (HSP10)
MKNHINLGNQASWEGSPVQDLESINAGRVHPEPVGEIDVDAEIMGKDLVVTPRKFHGLPNDSKGWKFQESPDAALQAQLVEEIPGYVGGLGYGRHDVRSLTVSEGSNPKARNRGSLVWYAISPGQETAVWGDRVIVEEDSVESEFSCRKCKGKGHTAESCRTCGGKLSYNQQPCRDCLVIGFGKESQRASGFKVCEECNIRLGPGVWVGTGHRGRVVIPEQSQSLPITGHVVSVGPQTVMAQLGDRVVFSKYAGSSIVNEYGVYRTLRESEILQLLRERSKEETCSNTASTSTP